MDVFVGGELGTREADKSTWWVGDAVRNVVSPDEGKGDAREDRDAKRRVVGGRQRSP